MLTKITSPSKLLKEETAQARLLIKRYSARKNEYDNLKQKVIVDINDPLFIFVYEEDSNSYTTDLSNELLYLHPKKCIIIARLRNEQYICSLRYSQANLEQILKEVLQITGGSGGGHEHACGAQIPQHQWDIFLEELRKRI